MQTEYEDTIRKDLIAAMEGEHSRNSLREAVLEVPEKIMNIRAEHVPYSLWDMLEHIRITQWDILRYIKDPGHTSPQWPQGYWPSKNATATTEKWEQSVSAYVADLEELKQLVMDNNTALFVPVKHMNGNSVLQKILLVINHTAYHTGEFIFCRQILGYWQSLLAGRE